MWNASAGAAMANASAASTRAWLSSGEAAVFWLVFAVLTAVGLFGNALVIAAIVGSRSMRRSLMNLLLANLAVADFANLLSCSLVWIQALITRTPIWILPYWACSQVRYLNEAFLFASLLLQVAVSVERYLATVKPLQVGRLCTRQTLVVWSAVVWAAAFAFAIPYAVVFVARPIPHTQLRVCVPRPDLPISYRVVECLSFYFIPLCLLSFLYLKIARLLWNNAAYLHESIRRAGRAEALARLQGRRRVVKMLACCVAVYFVCYSPIQVLFVSRLVPGLHIRITYSAVLWLNALCYASSACNPILYTLFSQRFRRRFLRLLCFWNKRMASRWQRSPLASRPTGAIGTVNGIGETRRFSNATANRPVYYRRRNTTADMTEAVDTGSHLTVIRESSNVVAQIVLHDTNVSVYV